MATTEEHELFELMRKHHVVPRPAHGGAWVVAINGNMIQGLFFDSAEEAIRRAVAFCTGEAMVLIGDRSKEDQLEKSIDVLEEEVQKGTERIAKLIAATQKLNEDKKRLNDCLEAAYAEANRQQKEKYKAREYGEKIYSELIEMGGKLADAEKRIKELEQPRPVKATPTIGKALESAFQRENRRREEYMGVVTDALQKAREKQSKLQAQWKGLTRD